MVSDSSHPSSHMFDLLLSGRLYRSSKTRTSRLRDSFIPQGITTLRAPLTHYHDTIRTMCDEVHVQSVEHCHLCFTLSYVYYCLDTTALLYNCVCQANTSCLHFSAPYQKWRIFCSGGRIMKLSISIPLRQSCSLGVEHLNPSGRQRQVYTVFTGSGPSRVKPHLAFMVLTCGIKCCQF